MLKEKKNHRNKNNTVVSSGGARNFIESGQKLYPV